MSSEASGSSAPLPYRLSWEEWLRSESPLALEHVVDGQSQLLGQDGPGFPRALFVLQAGEVVLRRCMVSEDQHGGFRKGPCEGEGASISITGMEQTPYSLRYAAASGRCSCLALGCKENSMYF